MMKSVALLLLCVLVQQAAAIGEGVVDIRTLTGLIGGVGSMFKKVQTVDVEQAKLLGRWFQMYKAAINFDVFRTQMFCPVAYFKDNVIMGSDGFSMEEAYRVISKNGPVETYKRDVTKVSPGTFWMYTEEYFYPRQFVIMSVGPNETLSNKTAAYEYLIATDANRLALMVFARDPQLFHLNYNAQVLQFLADNGFGGNSFWNSPQPIYQGPDCNWPSEKEVFARRVLKNQEKQNSAGATNGNVASGILQSITGR